jgi:hypothetical protein
MEQHDGLIQELGKADETLERLDLAHTGMTHTVEFRLDVATGHEPVGHPFDHPMVLGMRADQSTVLPGHHHDVQNLLIEKAHAIIGHEDLDRPMSALDQLRQIAFQRFRSRVGNPKVKGVVSHRAGCGKARVVLDDIAQSVSAMLGREGDDGRRAAEGCRTGCRLERIGIHQPAA